MHPKLALVSILTGKLEEMVAFYRDVIGFEVAFQMGEYIEFKNENIRFSICSLNGMLQSVDHPNFKQPRSGQQFELAFEAPQPQEVDRMYAEWVSKGAAPIQAPENMPWNERVAYFADPDGNVHELLAYLPQD